MFSLSGSWVGPDMGQSCHKSSWYKIMSQSIDGKNIFYLKEEIKNGSIEWKKCGAKTIVVLRTWGKMCKK